MKKSTLIVLGVFVALALTWGVTREPQVSAGVRKLSTTPINADAVVAIEVGPVSLQALDGGWTVTAGGATWQADSNQAQQLARELATLSAPDFITERTERHAELEVDAAKGVAVKARSATALVRDLVVGKASKAGGVYVRQASSNEVFDARGGLGYQVRRSVSDWRDKRIPVVVSPDEVMRVQVSPAVGTGFTLLKGDAWALEGATPAGFRFDLDAATRLVSQLSSLSAQDFVEADEPTPATLTVGLKSGGTRVLHVGPKRTDGTYALRVDGEKQTWLLPGYVGQSLAADLEGLRDTRLLHFDPKEVQELALLGGKSRAAARRDGTGWKLVEPKSPPAGLQFDSQQVDAQLARLGAMRGAKVVDVPAAKAGLGGAKVELTLTGGKKVLLRVGAKTGEDVYVVGSDPLVFTLPSAQLTWLEGGVELFKQPSLPPQGLNGTQGLDQLPPEVRAQLEAQLRQRQLPPGR